MGVGWRGRDPVGEPGTVFFQIAQIACSCKKGSLKEGGDEAIFSSFIVFYD
jgi:hypothetical protein